MLRFTFNQSELCAELTFGSCFSDVISGPMTISSGVPSPPSIIGMCEGGLPISVGEEQNIYQFNNACFEASSFFHCCFTLGTRVKAGCGSCATLPYT